MGPAGRRVRLRGRSAVRSCRWPYYRRLSLSIAEAQCADNTKYKKENTSLHNSASAGQAFACTRALACC